MSTQITAWNLKLAECNHVEKPLLSHLNRLGWDIIDLMQDLLTGKKCVIPLLNDTEVAGL